MAELMLQVASSTIPDVYEDQIREWWDTASDLEHFLYTIYLYKMLMEANQKVEEKE